MKRIKLPVIVESQTEPQDKNVIWKNGDSFKELKNGKWEESATLGGGGGGELDSLYTHVICDVPLFVAPSHSYKEYTPEGSAFVFIQDMQGDGKFIFFEKDENNNWAPCSVVLSDVRSDYDSLYAGGSELLIPNKIIDNHGECVDAPDFINSTLEPEAEYRYQYHDPAERSVAFINTTNKKITINKI